MKKFLLLAVLAVSASAFAANDAASLLGELQALDAEYQNLASQEEARFNEERAQAEAASQALAQNEQVYNELSQRAERLQAEANTRFYKSQYQELASKYQDALKKLEAEMEQQKSVISDFQKIEALRAGN
ncbi:adhesion protein FadA [Fusobacterium nucleatum]|uniref:adhesion protein FadA n=1 Tax=Fusobacterium nucleatum TaxID=851 RepID=UPI003D081A7D